MDISRSEGVEHELNRLIERRHDQRTVEERHKPSEELWQESIERYNAERDRILATAMQHLSRHSIAYVPLDVEEDIEISYQRDDLDGFRETVRGWMRQLRGIS